MCLTNLTLSEYNENEIAWVGAVNLNVDPPRGTFLHCAYTYWRLAYCHATIYEAYSKQNLRSFNPGASSDRSLLTCANMYVDLQVGIMV